MYNLKASTFGLMLQKDVVTGSVVDREGCVLVSVLEGGVEKVKLCSAAGSEQVVGFSVSDNESVTTDVVVETITVPSTSAYTVQLAHSNIAANPAGSGTLEEITVWVGATVLTQVNGAVNSGEYDCARATGILTFNAAQAGLTYTVRYRYNMTVAEARVKFAERNVNNQAGAIFNTVTVGCGVGEIETYEYDASVDWNNATTTTAVTCGANGRVTLGGSGSAVPAQITKLPTSDSPTLGLRFNFTM